MEEDKYTMYVVKKICIWMITAITILIAMDWIGMVLMGVLHSGYIRVMRDRR